MKQMLYASVLIEHPATQTSPKQIYIPSLKISQTGNGWYINDFRVSCNFAKFKEQLAS